MHRWSTQPNPPQNHTMYPHRIGFGENIISMSRGHIICDGSQGNPKTQNPWRANGVIFVMRYDFFLGFTHLDFIWKHDMVIHNFWTVCRTNHGLFSSFKPWITYVCVDARHEAVQPKEHHCFQANHRIKTHLLQIKVLTNPWQCLRILRRVGLSPLIYAKISSNWNACWVFLEANVCQFLLRLD